MGKKTTIYDIAKRLNTTASTVSRALNNSPKISKKTKDLVLETANKMNYQQNKLALALKSGKSNNVGVIVPRIDSNFFASIIKGIEENLYAHGYRVIICQTQNNQNIEVEIINTLLKAQVDGILMSISSINLDTKNSFNRILQKQIPLIFFDRKANIKDVSSVTINDFEAGYMATKHLINQGCKKIAHLSGNILLDIFNNRFLGYKKALEEEGIEFNKAYVLKIRSTVKDGQNAAKQLLKLRNPPNGIFSSSDYAALGAIQEIKANGIKIPGDIKVVGFANEPFTKFMELSISTIDQSPVEMGKIAANVFLQQSNNSENTKIEKNVVLAPKLIIRKSSLKHPNE
ncbi:LacI family DNA-binding transcriptional regulator [Algibacter pectinivorans]|uniref:Transcriptional regulator, LacI family n=1 Tax=Algibacter pectinivorans TaxID=870482 RepID=A0A1I1MJ65_9FLAO|nr:LacI family DNA-binding transcriptional regulator [Algibacter pectinivorans]SFC84912.1 transcriptional regulator, LacI family [Algibacter pectinivorans]